MSEYPRVDVTVDILLFAGEQILLIQRSKDPYAGQWALPGGFLDAHDDENLLAAAKRELHEETGLRVDKLHEVGVYSDINRDPRGRVVSTAFAAIVSEQQLLSAVAADDAADARVFPITNLPTLAFDHATIIADAVVKMKISKAN